MATPPDRLGMPPVFGRSKRRSSTRGGLALRASAASALPITTVARHVRAIHPSHSPRRPRSQQRRLTLRESDLRLPLSVSCPSTPTLLGRGGGCVAFLSSILFSICTRGAPPRFGGGAQGRHARFLVTIHRTIGHAAERALALIRVGRSLLVKPTLISTPREDRQHP